MQITPAVLESDFESVKEKVILAASFSSLVHIDVCDGAYVAAKSWPLQSAKEDMFFRQIVEQKEALPAWEDMDFEVHIMANQPELYIEDFIQAGFSRIIVHPDATENFAQIIEKVKGRAELFAALKLDVSEDVLKPIINDIDGVLLMGIQNVGQQGQGFEDEVLHRVSKMKALRSDIQVVIDGGVNKESILKVKNTETDRVIVGSGIFKATSPITAYEELENLVA